MKALQVYNQIQAAGVAAPAIKILDTDYKPIKLGWFRNDFAKLHAQFKKDIGQLKYVSNARDCDDFSEWARCFAQGLNAEGEDHQGSALAVGTFTYIQDSTGGIHQVNFAIVENGELAFYEPQTCQIVQLSQWEKELCSEARI